MRELSLFSGADGGLLASKHLLGWETIGYVEFNDYCQRVLAQRIKDGLLDNAPIFGDIRAFLSEGYAASYTGLVDVVSGGFPCQDLSCAGSRKGIDGARSGLWGAISEIIRIVQPRFVFVENSPELVRGGAGRVFGDLAEMGYGDRWGCLPASSLGAPHGRDRIWIHADSMPIRWGPIKQAISAENEKRDVANVWLPDGFFVGLRDGTPWKTGETQREVFGEPKVRRMDDGMADWVDRLKAIGNGQVPIVAATAWRILSGQ